MSKLSESSAPLSVADLGVLSSLATRHGPLAVTQLYLDDHSFGDDGIAAVAPLLADQTPHLEALVLRSDAIGREGVVALCEALGARRPPTPLQRLDLAHNRISDDGIGVIVAELLAGRLLVDAIDVSGNAQVSSEAERTLSEALKQARVAARDWGRSTR